MGNVILFILIGVLLYLMGFGCNFFFVIAMETSKWWVGFPSFVLSLILGLGFLFCVTVIFLAILEELK